MDKLFILTKPSVKRLFRSIWIICHQVLTLRFYEQVIQRRRKSFLFRSRKQLRSFRLRSTTGIRCVADSCLLFRLRSTINMNQAFGLLYILGKLLLSEAETTIVPNEMSSPKCPDR